MSTPTIEATPKVVRLHPQKIAVPHSHAIPEHQNLSNKQIIYKLRRPGDISLRELKSFLDVLSNSSRKGTDVERPASMIFERILNMDQNEYTMDLVAFVLGHLCQFTCIDLQHVSIRRLIAKLTFFFVSKPNARISQEQFEKIVKSLQTLRSPDTSTYRALRLIASQNELDFSFLSTFQPDAPKPRVRDDLTRQEIQSLLDGGKLSQTEVAFCLDQIVILSAKPHRERRALIQSVLAYIERLQDVDVTVMSEMIISICKLPMVPLKPSHRKKFLKTMASNFLRQLSAIDAREAFNAAILPSVLNALAKLGYLDEHFYQEIGEFLIRYARVYDTVQIRLICDVYSNMESPPPKLWETLAETVRSTIYNKNAEVTGDLVNVELTGGDLAYFAMAFAKAGINDMELFGAISTAACSVFLAPNDIAALLSTFALVKIRPKALLDRLLPNVAGDITQFNARQLSTTAHAFAKLGISDKEVFGAISKRSMPWLHLLPPQELALLSWSFAELRVRPPMVFLDVAKKSVLRMSDSADSFTDVTCTCKDLSMIAWSFAAMGITTQSVFYAIVRSFVTKLKDADEDDISNLLWSLAVVNYKPHGDELVHLLQLLPLLKLSEPNQLLVHQWNVSLSSHNRAKLVVKVPQLPLVLDECFRATQRDSEPLSKFAADLFPLIPDLAVKTGIKFLPRVVCPKTGFPLYFASITDKFVIMLQNSWNYVDGTSVLNAPSRLKVRLLRKGGWNVLNVSYKEWTQFAEEDRLEFLSESIDGMLEEDSE